MLLTLLFVYLFQRLVRSTMTPICDSDSDEDLSQLYACQHAADLIFEHDIRQGVIPTTPSPSTPSRPDDALTPPHISPHRHQQHPHQPLQLNLYHQQQQKHIQLMQHQEQQHIPHQQNLQHYKQHQHQKQHFLGKQQSNLQQHHHHSHKQPYEQDPMQPQHYPLQQLNHLHQQINPQQQQMKIKLQQQHLQRLYAQQQQKQEQQQQQLNYQRQQHQQHPRQQQEFQQYRHPSTGWTAASPVTWGPHLQPASVSTLQHVTTVSHQQHVTTVSPQQHVTTVSPQQHVTKDKFSTTAQHQMTAHNPINTPPVSHHMPLYHPHTTDYQRMTNATTDLRHTPGYNNQQNCGTVTNAYVQSGQNTHLTLAERMKKIRRCNLTSPPRHQENLLNLLIAKERKSLKGKRKNVQQSHVPRGQVDHPRHTRDPIGHVQCSSSPIQISEHGQVSSAHTDTRGPAQTSSVPTVAQGQMDKNSATVEQIQRSTVQVEQQFLRQTYGTCFPSEIRGESPCTALPRQAKTMSTRMQSSHEHVFDELQRCIADISPVRTCPAQSSISPSCTLSTGSHRKSGFLGSTPSSQPSVPSTGSDWF